MEVVSQSSNNHKLVHSLQFQTSLFEGSDFQKYWATKAATGDGDNTFRAALAV